MNINETFALYSKSANEGYASLRKLAEINLNTMDQLFAKQMEVVNLCFANAAEQAELLKQTKRVDELVSKQAELVQGLGEKLAESNKQVVEILSNTREEYQGWAEESVAQARSKMSEAAEVVKHAQAA